MFRFRFRLITLLAVMTLIAFVAGAYGIHRRAQLAEDLAFRKISQKGGWVVVEHDTSYVDFYVKPTEQVVDCVTGVDRVYPPQNSSQDFSDQDLALFDDVQRYCDINLTNTRVSPTAAKEFRKRHPKWHIEYPLAP